MSNDAKKTAEVHSAMFKSAGMSKPGLSVVPVLSDAMYPTVKPGDGVLVDTTISEYVGEGLYVLDTDAGPQIRRLTARVKAGVLVTCDNTIYPPDTTNRDRLEEIILGKVVALGVVEDRKLLEHWSN